MINMRKLPPKINLRKAELNNRKFIQVEQIFCQKCEHKLTCCRVCTEFIKMRQDDNCDIMIVGQGAGKKEDINMTPTNTNRRPFVGPAGKYLRHILAHLAAYNYMNIALTNTVRCHPVDTNGKDREPSIAEEQQCEQVLERDIFKLEPKVIVSVGASATKKFIQRYRYQFFRMGKIRGHKYQPRMDGIHVIPTYHPSYLCRSNGQFNKKNLTDLDKGVITDINYALTTAAQASIKL